jgi:hypothetical protein
MGTKRTRSRVIFLFGEPMMLFEVGRYSVLYDVDPSSRTVVVHHATGPLKPSRPRRKPRSRLRAS